MALNHAILEIVHIDGISPVFLDTVPIDETFSFEISIIHFCLEYRNIIRIYFSKLLSNTGRLIVFTMVTTK
jgi:hypothetical protein